MSEFERETEENHIRRRNWMRRSFIPEVSSIQTEIEVVRSSVDGQEIRAFYESIVSSSEQNVSKEGELSTIALNIEKNKDKKKETKVSCKSDLSAVPSIHRFLQFAQNGEIDKLRQSLELGMNVNARDDYGWTALMCAASNGSKESVRFLLRRGADKKLVERSGRSAVLLANRSGHSHIVRILTEEEKDKELKVVKELRTVSLLGPSTTSSNSKSDKFFCEICRGTVEGTTRSAHLSSTVHQFNERREERRAPPMTVYHIPETNVGFQLMLKDGWDRERGLGPDGTGIKFPPKTTLKRNRKGLGHGSKLKSRVTHFGPGDVSAVERQHTNRTATKLRPKTIERFERDRKERRQKQMEIEFRKQFSALE